MAFSRLTTSILGARCAMRSAVLPTLRRTAATQMRGVCGCAVRYPPAPADKTVYLCTSGDLRQSANKGNWAVQKAMEDKLCTILTQKGYQVVRAHAYDPEKGHGFLDSQRSGMKAFENVPSNARVVVAETVWQYSHHVLAGLQHHKGPILTVANFDGRASGLVGMLNLNGSMTKFGVPFSTLWSVEFTDEFFQNKLNDWLSTGRVVHDVSHSRDLNPSAVPAAARAKAAQLVADIKKKKIILGVFDEGCMGMANAILEDHLLNPAGIFKERLSQSALFAGMQRVTEAEAMAVMEWMTQRGFKFHLGTNERKELTISQVLQQCKMYIAAVRIAAEFSVDAIGIQYQQGLKDLTPASDLAEGFLNNVERPPVFDEAGGVELFAGQALPHFNEVDEGAAVDAVITNRVWKTLGLDPATTLHDIRWGEDYNGQFVWVFLISGAAPPSHHVNGIKGSYGYRQDPMYFPLGGSTLGGVAKPGEIVWSRVYNKNMEIHADLGRATVVELPAEETQRRLDATTPTWPIMSAVLHGVSRDQMMARHPANHIQVAYGANAKSADEALALKASVFQQLGFKVHLCGTVKL